MDLKDIINLINAGYTKEEIEKLSKPEPKPEPQLEPKPEPEPKPEQEPKPEPKPEPEMPFEKLANEMKKMSESVTSLARLIVDSNISGARIDDNKPDTIEKIVDDFFKGVH